jgi:proprotein convertase subtilisin/kexin type 5
MKEKVYIRNNKLKLRMLVALILLTTVNTCAPQKDFQGCCLDNCPPTWYANWQHPNLCAACNHPCENCVGPINGDCHSCRVGYIAWGMACCLPNQYSIYPSCYNCHPACAACTGGANVNCTSCYPSTYLNGITCDACHAYCNICTGPSASECSGCRYGYYLDGTTC